ncbi:hypothetical protein Hanom_Chr15g01348621 [Helianthus anomalus]
MQDNYRRFQILNNLSQNQIKYECINPRILTIIYTGVKPKSLAVHGRRGTITGG